MSCLLTLELSSILEPVNIQRKVLDFDLYAPTAAALKAFLPRVPKGGVIVFDELNNASWPGETAAVHEVVGLSRLRIQRFAFEPHISYCVVE
jgi:Macrocin-O-methyltransferase (TylF)